MTSYENTPGAGAEPGLLRSHLRDAAVLCMGTEQRERRPRQGDAGRQRRAHTGVSLAAPAQPYSRESKHGYRPIAPAKTHPTRPLKPITDTKYDKSCNK